MDYQNAQRRLMARGYDVGSTGADGVPGRNTAKAIRLFQTASGLAATGQLDRATIAALADDAEAGLLLPPWYDLAQSKIGLREVPGPRHNSEIVDWVDLLGGGWDDDETAWCGTFVGFCIATTLPEEPIPNNPFGARNWMKLGREVEPALGAVLVFWRGERKGWLGHVGFYAGEDASAFHVLGGNQGNAVSIARIARTRLLGARWPSTAAEGPGGRLAKSGGGAVSQNEA